MLPLFVSIPKQVKEQVPHRVGGVVAIVEQVVISSVTRIPLVHAIGFDKL